MTVDPLEPAEMRRVRKVLKTYLPGAKPSHIAEAVAAGWGYKTHAAQLVDGGTGDTPNDRSFSYPLFAARLAELGVSIPQRNVPQIEGFLIGAMKWRPGGPFSEGREPQLLPEEAAMWLRVAEAMAVEGCWEKVGKTAVRVLEMGSAEQRAAAFSVLGRAAEYDDQARVNLGLAYARGDGTPRDLASAVAILEEMAESRSDILAADAHAFLATIALGKFGGRKDAKKSLFHTERAAELGHDESPFSAGLVYAEGGTDIQADPEKAEFYYRMGADRGNHMCMTNLAMMLLDGKRHEEGLMLLRRSAALGDERAEAKLDMLDHVGGSDTAWQQMVDAAKADPDAFVRNGIVPPIRVVPLSMKRPRLVAQAIMRAFGDIPLEVTHGIVGAIYGFGSWKALEKAVGSGPSDRSDEQSDQQTVAHRRAFQAQVLKVSLPVDDSDARIAANLLAATSSVGKPSLRRLADGRAEAPELTDASSLEQELTELMEAVGIEHGGDPFGLMERTRARSPVHADVWLPFLEQKFGWRIEDPAYEACTHGAHIGTVVASNGRRARLHLAANSNLPGGAMMALGQRFRDEIASAGGDVVLLYDRPIFWVDGDDPTDDTLRGHFYGGEVFLNGAWFDFTLRPGSGFDDVIAQEPFKGEILSPAFVRRFSIEAREARSCAYIIAALIEGLEPEEATVGCSKTRGWYMLHASADGDRTKGGKRKRSKR